MVIHYKKLYQYFLIYLVVIMQGSVLFFTYQDSILLLFLLIALVFCLKHWKSIKIDTNFIIVILLVISLLTEVLYTKGSLSIPSVLNVFCKIFVIHYCGIL